MLMKLATLINKSGPCPPGIALWMTTIDTCNPFVDAEVRFSKIRVEHVDGERAALLFGRGPLLVIIDYVS